MDKRQVVEEIKAYLAEELNGAQKAPEPGPSARPPAPPDPERVRELESLLVMYRFLPLPTYGAGDVVCPGALVELSWNGVSAHYFVTPKGGGLVMRVGGKPVQVVTPQSPIGEAILGRCAGDQVDVPVRTGVRSYQILAVT